MLQVDFIPAHDILASWGAKRASAVRITKTGLLESLAFGFDSRYSQRRWVSSAESKRFGKVSS